MYRAARPRCLLLAIDQSISSVSSVERSFERSLRTYTRSRGPADPGPPDRLPYALWVEKIPRNWEKSDASASATFDRGPVSRFGGILSRHLVGPFIFFGGNGDICGVVRASFGFSTTRHCRRDPRRRRGCVVVVAPARKLRQMGPGRHRRRLILIVTVFSVWLCPSYFSPRPAALGISKQARANTKPSSPKYKNVRGGESNSGPRKGRFFRPRS